MKKPYELILGVILILLGIKTLNNPYMSEQPTTVTVLENGTEPAGYKHDARPYLVLKEQKSGRLFDLRVSHAFAYSMPVGTTTTIMLRKFDWWQTPMETTVYFFGTVILLTVGGCIFIASLVFRLPTILLNGNKKS